MIKALRALFELPETETPQSLEGRLNLAAAALLVETARADFTQDLEEDAMLEEVLADTFNLPPAEVHELVREASETVAESTSLYQFTRLINDHYTPEQKLNLVGAMWRVAYADGNLDKYEEHLIRKIAELTYVPHGDYIKSKVAASERAD